MRWFKRASPDGSSLPPEEAILRDQGEQKVFIGAMAVRTVKIDDQGREVEHKRFISVLAPSCEETLASSLANGRLSLMSLKEDEELTLESEDMDIAFNLFLLPPAWAGFLTWRQLSSCRQSRVLRMGPNL